MEKLIAREYEAKTLNEAVNSDKSELILLKGRLRVVKTFLVRNFFKDKYFDTMLTKLQIKLATLHRS